MPEYGVIYFFSEENITHVQRVNITYDQIIIQCSYKLTSCIQQIIFESFSFNCDKSQNHKRADSPCKSRDVIIWRKTSVCKNVIKKSKNIHTVDLYHLVLLASNVAKLSENQADNCEVFEQMKQCRNDIHGTVQYIGHFYVPLGGVSALRSSDICVEVYLQLRISFRHRQHAHCVSLL